MNRAHLLWSSLGVLALASCAPSGKDDAAGPLPRYELAKAKDSAVEAPSVVDLSVEELRAKLDKGEIRLIDVRTDAEVAQGVIPGAEHIELDSFDPAKLDLSDGRAVVLYCRSGRRSAIAAQALSAHIGESAQHLEGGILAWQDAGEPVEAH